MRVQKNTRRVLLAIASVMLILPLRAVPAPAIDFPAGNLQGTITWNGVAVSGGDASRLGVTVEGVGNAGVDFNTGRYAFSSIRTGDHAVTAYAFGCANPPNQLVRAHATVVAASTTTADIDLTGTAGRLTGRITVNGTPLAYPVIYPQGLCGGTQGDGLGAFERGGSTRYLRP